MEGDEIFSLADITEAYRKLRERETVLATSDPRVAAIASSFPGCRVNVIPGLPSNTVYVISPEAAAAMVEWQGEIIIAPGYERVVKDGTAKLVISGA